MRPERSRPLLTADCRTVAWFSIETLSLHVGQYLPCERVSRKPRTLRRSLIVVSDIVGSPHRSHSIAMSRSDVVDEGDIKRRVEHIKNNVG